MATAITLDEFFEMAQLGGQIKAIHDIFEIINEDSDDMADKLQNYQKSVVADFTKAQLRFRMGGGKVRMDEESIEGLGDD